MKAETPMLDCPQETTVAAALAHGELPEDLRLHVAGCAVCAEVHSVARELHLFSNRMSDNPAPSAASMWWRLNIRMRLEKARRAQQPLIWMGRVSYAAIAITIGLLVMQIPGLSQPAAVAGLMALGAVALPVTIALWGWSRSKV